MSDEPSSPAEIRKRERELKALEVYWRTRKVGEVRKALKLATNGDAEALIARAESRYWIERGENLDKIRGSALNELDQMTDELWVAMREELDVSERLSIIDRALKVNEQRRRLTGADVVRENEGGGVSFVINTKLPDDVMVDEDPPKEIESGE